MSAPIGRTFPVFAQLALRSLQLKRPLIQPNFLSCFTIKYCINQMSIYPHKMKNDASFAHLLPVAAGYTKCIIMSKSNRLNQQSRNLSAATTLTDEEIRKEIDAITDTFMEAKEYLEDAKDSMDSVYFDEDMKDAEDSIEETLTMYQDLLARLNEEQKQNVTRTIGLKMEELKAQIDMIKESLRD